MEKMDISQISDKYVITKLIPEVKEKTGKLHCWGFWLREGGEEKQKIAFGNDVYAGCWGTNSSLS